MKVLRGMYVVENEEDDVCILLVERRIFEITRSQR